MKTVRKTMETSRSLVCRSMSRRAKPRLLAYTPSRMVEVCGCSTYSEGSCGRYHSGNTGPGCGHYSEGCCGINWSND